MGAAGRDFHNFNVYFRNNEEYEVVAFTATQIPYITDRKYPPELSGPKYPKGIPIYPEEELPKLIKKFKVDHVVFGYSDVPYTYVMNRASIVLSNGADFRLMGPWSTMLPSDVPIIAVCAVRTGSGKSPTTRRIASILREKGINVVAIRHPMPYGDLKKQICQRFESYEDLNKHKTTIEEREEYEPLIDMGIVVFAGTDYGKILKEAEKEAQVIVWDGGNNDLPFYKPDLHIVVADPHRVGHERTYHPGETNARMADLLIINKVGTAPPENVSKLEQNLRTLNPKATIIKANSSMSLDDSPDLINGKRVLCIEDGPTVTHGDMAFGAAILAAKTHGAAEIVDPRQFAKGSIKDVYQQYTHLEAVLPAMGYGKKQTKELENTIKAIDCDTVIIGTPIDLRRVVKIKQPTIRVRYSLEEIGTPNLETILDEFLANLKG
ncbi:MAG: cyclic 2,3-diphosphoglycerate synthase [Candidatus Heimdallarchaeota archaeon]